MKRASFVVLVVIFAVIVVGLVSMFIPVLAQTPGGNMPVGGGNVTVTGTCSSGQVVKWNGSAYVCGTASGSGTVTSVATGTGLTGGPITGSGTVSLASSWQALQTATVTLTNTQVNSLTADCRNQITLLAAPGAGYWLRVIDVSMIYTYGSAAFTVPIGANQSIGWGESSEFYISGIGDAGFLDQTASMIEEVNNSNSAQNLNMNGIGGSALGGGAAVELDQFDNEPFFVCSGSSSAATSGGAGSTETFNILYRVEAD